MRPFGLETGAGYLPPEVISRTGYCLTLVLLRVSFRSPVFPEPESARPAMASYHTVPMTGGLPPGDSEEEDWHQPERHQQEDDDIDDDDSIGH